MLLHGGSGGRGCCARDGARGSAREVSGEVAECVRACARERESALVCARSRLGGRCAAGQWPGHAHRPARTTQVRRRLCRARRSSVPHARTGAAPAVGSAAVTGAPCRPDRSRGKRARPLERGHGGRAGADRAPPRAGRAAVTVRPHCRSRRADVSTACVPARNSAARRPTPAAAPAAVTGRTELAALGTPGRLGPLGKSVRSACRTRGAGVVRGARRVCEANPP